MITKNTLYKWFNDFADNHTQIKDFGYGDYSDISMEIATTYPLMWVSPQPCPVEGYEIKYTYIIAIADRVWKDRENAVEVESDTMQICLDLLASLDDQSSNNWELDYATTITPFVEKWKDEVEGNFVTVVLKAPFNYDNCQIPKIN